MGNNERDRVGGRPSEAFLEETVKMGIEEKELRGRLRTPCKARAEGPERRWKGWSII